MMERLMQRAQSVVRKAQQKRLQQIAEALSRRGIAAERDGESVTVRGHGLVQRWLADPLVRFAGRTAA